MSYFLDHTAETNASMLREMEELVARGEGEQAEFKLSTGQRTEAVKTVCAMLNASGGFVVFGVSDNRILVGQQVSPDTLEALVRELKRIDPQPLLSPETVDLPNGRALILIRVPRADPPYTYDGRPYIRMGPTTSVMSSSQYQRMMVERMQPSNRWELLPSSLTIGDLDGAEVIRTAEEAIGRGRMEDPGTRRVEHLLLGLNLLLDDTPRNAAVVLFARADRVLPLYPQCLLRLARFRGRDNGEFVDGRQEVGNAFQAFHRAQRFLRDHVPVAGRIVPGLYERVDDPLYPPVALREAIANALCHRDYAMHGGSVGIAIYDDRVEISSSGPLRFGLRSDDLSRPHPSCAWNPLIASVFYVRGMIERWGRGTLKIGELSELAGLVKPDFHERAGEVVVRFFPSSYVPPTRVSHDLTELQRRILLSLAEEGPGSSAVVTRRLADGTSNDRVLRALQQLRHLGLVQIMGATRGGQWTLGRRDYDPG
ncbi:MAG TPA: RNA-binding domain-containing protein [Longimicrobium sp.]|uniref:RNA-binding domain-containing protein n=1 Tax=Longimicrobium sp. TaxID=2029185 RepID=UPI002EDA6AE1